MVAQVEAAVDGALQEGVGQRPGALVVDRVQSNSAGRGHLFGPVAARASHAQQVRAGRGPTDAGRAHAHAAGVAGNGGQGLPACAAVDRAPQAGCVDPGLAAGRHGQRGDVDVLVPLVEQRPGGAAVHGAQHDAVLARGEAALIVAELDVVQVAGRGRGDGRPTGAAVDAAADQAVLADRDQPRAVSAGPERVAAGRQQADLAPSSRRRRWCAAVPSCLTWPAQRPGLCWR